MTFRPVINRVALVLFCCLAAAMTFSGTSAFGMDKDTLRVAELWEIEGMDIASHEGTFLKEKALVVETLVEADSEFNLKPHLAKSWKMRSDTEWEFTLRQGVKFHDGSPLTAQAVVDCLKRTLEIDASVKRFTKIKDLRAEGDHTVIIITEQLYPMLPAALVYSDTSIMSLKSKTNEQGAVIHPIGTGPYMLAEWKEAENVVVLERFDGYWGNKPKIEKIIYRAVPDPATRSLEIQKGSLDFIPDAPYGDLEMLRQKGLNVQIANTARLYLINFGSLKGTPYEDPAVRQAISLAINRGQIVHRVLFGMGKAAVGPFEESMSFANKDLQPLAYDPKAARDKLAQAGWKDSDGDGVVEKNGKPFAVTLFTYPQRPGLRPMAQALQAQFQAIGLKIELRVMDWSAITKSMKPTDMRLVAGATAMIPTADYFLRNYYHSKGNSNGWHYDNPEVDRLFAIGSKSVDEKERKKAYDKIQTLIHADMPIIPVSYYGVNIVMKPEIKNFKFNPVAHDFMLNTDMYVE